MTDAILGWALLFALTSFAVLNALGVALRASPRGRAELGVLASLVFFAIVSAPVLALGYTNTLGRASLALASLALNAAVLFSTTRFRAIGGHVRACAAAARDLWSMPFEALRECAHARSMVVVGVLVVFYVLGLAFLLTVFVPNGTWDGFLYHEPIIGFAIQNHGFAIVDMQMAEAVQAANGYPHLCESVAIFFVIFTDKTLVELPNDLAAPAMMLACYVLVRRFADRRSAIAWACVLLLVPQAWAQLCQTYLDLEVAFFAIAAIALATKSNYGARDAAFATLALLLLEGSKSSALAMVPPIALLAYVRIARDKPALVATGSIALAAFGALVPIRDWIAFRDPLWPITFDSDTLGIHWKGLITVRELASANVSLLVAYDNPIGGLGDVIERGYGYAVAWVLVPVAAIAFVAALVETVRTRGRSDVARVLILTIAGVVGAPSLNGHNARYNLHIVACSMALAAWWLARPKWSRAREGVLSAAVLLSAMPLAWMKGPAWYWVATKHYEDVFRHPLESRVALRRPEFDALGRQREELREGDTVAFDGNVDFIGALWNFHYSNRVVYVPWSPRFLADVDREKATWVATGEDDDARHALEGTGEWEYVGPIAPTNTYAVFRRKSR